MNPQNKTPHITSSITYLQDITTYNDSPANIRVAASIRPTSKKAPESPHSSPAFGTYMESPEALISIYRIPSPASPEDVLKYSHIRLSALKTNPKAFCSAFEDAAKYYGNRDGRAAKHTLKLLTNSSGIRSRMVLICQDLEDLNDGIFATNNAQKQ